jgi:hypothetical protein
MPSQAQGGTPSQTIKRLDFPEKLLQPGKRDSTDALLRRIKVSGIPSLIGAMYRLLSVVHDASYTQVQCADMLP